MGTSNDLGRSLVDHPHQIATVTGDALMLRPDDYGARIAFVDYDGEAAFERYRAAPPKSAVAERRFVEENAPHRRSRDAAAPCGPRFSWARDPTGCSWDSWWRGGVALCTSYNSTSYITTSYVLTICHSAARLDPRCSRGSGTVAGKEASMMDVGFIGRRDELRVLENSYRGKGSAFVPIYGRRRVGKSELIRHFMKGKPGIYFLGKTAPAALQIREFLQEAAAVLAEPLLASFPADGWKAALTAVTDRWTRKRKLILVLDEFQWIAGASPELPSVLQECWDLRWKRAGNILLILCGSYVGFMEREVLGGKSPLFGGRTAQILLKPFGYREAAEFHPSYSLPDRARTYFVCGGIPLYLRHFSSGVSVEGNIVASILDEYAPLHREPDFLLREELREVDRYYAVLLAVAAGHTSNGAIAQQAGVGERSLHYYLQQLIELGYLRRRYPLTGRRPASRHVRYELDDPLVRFWFRFVFPHTSYILQMGPRRAFRDLIRPHLPTYFGSCFERLCREALPMLYTTEGITASFEVGEYWDKATQVDVVGLRDDGWTDLGECKWGYVRSEGRLVRELEGKVARYPNPRNATIGRRIFTRTPVRPAGTSGQKRMWHCLEDLYGS